MATTPKKPGPQPGSLTNRLMLSFGTKYAGILGDIIHDASEDDRQPAEYLVRWLAKNYGQLQAAIDTKDSSKFFTKE